MKIKNSNLFLWLLCLSFSFMCGCTSEAQYADVSSQIQQHLQEQSLLETEKTAQVEVHPDQGDSYIKDIIVYLSGMQDRLTSSDNNAVACSYIAEQFEEIGLQPFVQKGYYLEYQQQMDGKDVAVNNVVGYLKGSDSKQAVVVSCHLDSVEGAPGAVDNASGVAAMLQTARGLYPYRDSLKDDIIFCAFNGEEQNYAGSAAFVEAFQGLYDTACNINYDCVGVINGGEYMFGAEESSVGYNINSALRPFLDKNEIQYSDYPVSGIRSDHISFHNAGIPNVDFTQIGILSITHSPNDTMVHLDMEQIHTLAGAITEYLISSQER